VRSIPASSVQLMSGRRPSPLSRTTLVRHRRPGTAVTTPIAKRTGSIIRMPRRRRGVIKTALPIDSGRCGPGAAADLGSRPVGPGLGSVLAPYLPRRVARGVQVLDALLVLGRVHREPEAVVVVSQELVVAHQSLKRLKHQLVAVLDVIEDITAEDEEAAVHPESGLRDVAETADTAAVLRGHEVVAQVRLDAQEARHGVVRAEMGDLIRQREICEPVAVVREEDLLA